MPQFNALGVVSGGEVECVGGRRDGLVAEFLEGYGHDVPHHDRACSGAIAAPEFFAFVARQRHIHFDGEDFYIDLVFYNFILKCFLLIDLKNGKLTHRDVGQMDDYARIFEDRFRTPGDNPTIGLILCSDNSEAVARYSVLSESRQIFASKYLQFLPSEEELQVEIQRERQQIEATLEEKTWDDA